MAKDTRVFKILYSEGKVKYGSRLTATGAVSTNLRGYIGRPVQVWATDEAATTGWADVTTEFLSNEPKPLRCEWHPQYTGARKPQDRSWLVSPNDSCNCWEVYARQHPGYPAHSFCDKTTTDPAECDCRVLKNLLE
jgi:hypothetical protein